MMALPGLQTLDKDRFEKAGRGAGIQHRRWHARHMRQSDGRCGVALDCADLPTIGRQRNALLVVAGDHCTDQVCVQRPSSGSGSGGSDQGSDVGPSSRSSVSPMDCGACRRTSLRNLLVSVCSERMCGVGGVARGAWMRLYCRALRQTRRTARCGMQRVSACGVAQAHIHIHFCVCRITVAGCRSTRQCRVAPRVRPGGRPGPAGWNGRPWHPSPDAAVAGRVRCWRSSRPPCVAGRQR